MDFISSYLEHTSDTEAPMLFHRWSAISIIAATLGRQMYFQLGHFRINPNLYIMIMGEAASRKSTAIKIAKKLLVKSGYSNIAANKTSKEKFLLNMATSSDEALA